ncbi:MAG: hypothetical protein Q9195_005973 [Heterodermia aff. obscurata]
MLPRPRLTTTLQSRASLKAGLVMSAISAGLADNDRDPFGDKGTFVAESSRPSKTTNSAPRPAKLKPSVIAAKNKTWQPSDGIVFGQKHSQPFSTAARQCSRPESTSPKAPPARSSDDDGNDGFGEDEEDIGELLARSELSDQGFDECPMAGTEPPPKPQQLSETDTMHGNPSSPEAPINLKILPRKPPDRILVVKKSKAKRSPKTKYALTKVSVPANGILATAIRSQEIATAPPHLGNSQTGGKEAPLCSLPDLHDPYSPRRATQKELGSLVSEDYLFSPEITRLAQIPRQVRWHVSPTELEDEQLDEPMLDGDPEELKVLYDLWNCLSKSHKGIQSRVTSVICEIKNAKARSPDKSLMIRLRLQDMSDSIRSSFTEIQRTFHNVRMITRIRCALQASLRPGPHDLYEKQISSIKLQRYRATEIIDLFLDSHYSIIRAFIDLKDFRRRRQMKPLFGPRSRSIYAFLNEFTAAKAYKQSLEEPLKYPGPRYASARRTVESLSSLAQAFKDWSSEITDASRAKGVCRKGSSEYTAFFASCRGLEEALVNLLCHGDWIMARDLKLNPEISTGCEVTGPLHSPYEYTLTKQAVDTGQEVARRPGMMGLEYNRLRRRPKDQIQNIGAQTRCYSNQNFQPTPERSKSPSAFHDYDYLSRARLDLLQRQQVTADIAKRTSTRNIAQNTHIDDVSPLEELPQSRVSSAARHPSSHSPKGFTMSCSDVKSNTNDDSNIRPVNWSYALYSGPKNERVKVHYCKNKVDTERIAQLFRDEEVIGFDIEWKANAQAKDGIKQNVSLIQMASEERVALFHVARYRDEESREGLVAPTLKVIMESPQITKVGVNIKGDCTRLQRFLGIESRGLFELSHLYKLVKYSGGDTSSINKRLVRLATQVEEHLGLPLSKGAERMSDWSLALDLNQVQYAASDSYAGFQLFHEMEHKRKHLIPTPPRPYHAELNQPIRFTSGKSIETDDEPEDLNDELSTTSQPPSIEELARDFLQIKSTCRTLPAKKPAKRVPRPSARPSRPEVIMANEWVAKWHSMRPLGYKSAVAPACLRAHALWHEQGFTVPEAATLLRDPPLLNATVAAYVLDALRAEKLPFEKERLAALILHVPQAMKGRYKSFLKKAGIKGH